MMVNGLDDLKTHLDTFDEYVVEMSDKSPKRAAVRKAITISCDDSVDDSVFLDDSGRSNLDEEMLKEAKKNLGKNKKGTTFVKSKASYPAEGTLEALLSRNKEEIAARSITPRKTFEDAEEPKSLISRMLMRRTKKETEEIVSKSRLNQAIKDNAFVVKARQTKPTATRLPVVPFAKDEKSASSARPSSAVNHLSLIEDEEAAFPNESLSSIDPNIVSGSASSLHFDPFFNEESATSFFEGSNGSDYSFFEGSNGSSFSSSFGCDNPVLFDYDATERTNSTRSLSVSEDGEPSERDDQSPEVSPCKSSSSRRLLVDSPVVDGNEDNRRTGERKVQKRIRVKPSTGKRNSKDKMKCIRQLPSPRSGQHSKGRTRRSRTEDQIQSSRHRRGKRASAPVSRSDHTVERSKSRERGSDSLSESRRSRPIRSGTRQRRSSKSSFPDQNRIAEPQDVGRPQDRSRTPIRPQNKDMRRSRSVDVLAPVSSDAHTGKSPRRRKLATNRCRSRSPGHTRPVRSRSLRRVKGDEQGFQEPSTDDPFEVLNSPVQRISSWLKKQQSSMDKEEQNIHGTATPEVKPKPSSSHVSRGERSSSRSVSTVSSPTTNRSEASSRRKDSDNSLGRSQSMGNLSNATTSSKPLRRALKGTSSKSRRALLETGGSIQNTPNNINSGRSPRSRPRSVSGDVESSKGTAQACRRVSRRGSCG